MAALAVRPANETVHITERQFRAARTIEATLFEGNAAAHPHLEFVHDDGRRLRLPDELVGLVLAALDAARNESTLTIGAMPEDLTTTAAASLLGVSRPTLMKWIRAGEIPAHKVGTHTRLKAKDVLEVRAARRQAERRAVLEMMAIEDELEDYS